MSEEQGMASKADHAENDEVRKVWDLMKRCKFAMLTTTQEDGSLHARPMATLSQQGFDGTVWFFTQASSPKVGEVDRHEEVNLAYSDPDKQNYVSVAGTAHVVRDKAKAKELWSEPLRTWFPKGLDDPELALLRVDMKSAQYWDSPSSAVVHAYGYVKAALTGTPPNPGDHGTVRIG
jgi:general stress protein 26